MIEINLLPKGYRKKQVSFSVGKSGVYAVAGAIGVVLMLIGVTVFQMNQVASLDDNIEKAQQRAAMLQKDIQLVDALTDVKQKISARMSAVEQLDSHRSAWVRILEDLSVNVPEFVWLGRFTEKGLAADTAKPAPKLAYSTVTTQPKEPVEVTSAPVATATPTGPKIMPVELEGYAFTLNALASFMINTMRSDYFEEVELVSTKETTLGEYRAYNFVLSAKLHYLSDEDLQGMVAQAEAEKASEQSQSRHKSLN